MKRLIFSLFGILISFAALSCSCGGSRSFCEIVGADTAESLTIVSGEKIRDIHHGMEFRVHQVYRGTVNQSVIKVWGDPGWLCRLYTYLLDDGEELILALGKLETLPPQWSIEHEETGDYELSVCGQYYIKCDDLGMEDIEACLGVENICGCTDAKAVTFYPNPTTGVLYSESFPYSEEEKRTISIYDISGKLVKNIAISNQMYQGERLEVDLLGLPTGVYIIDFNFRDQCGEKNKQRIVVV